MQRLISMLLENEPGALARVAGLFSARGYNIESLSVAPTEDSTMSRLTLATSGDDAVIEQITKQLHKLVDVIKLVDLTDGPFVERELMLIKVRASDPWRNEVRHLTEIFRGRILDVAGGSFVIELTGARQKLDAFVDALDEKCILEVVRSGAMGVGRGDRSLRA
ncbi:MAG: acetolactate synthase small subunit [Immundisolibacterales bacterium]|nr:acetolactate synthase small subunit [Immundisolibacterales bacterium]